MNIRKFMPEDIDKFPQLHILSIKDKSNTISEHLRIERRDFISCLVIIDNTFSLFVEQFRPIIKRKSLEIPMGKTEKFDLNPEKTAKRELQEECNIFVNENPYILVRNGLSTRKIFFKECHFDAYQPISLNLEISTCQQYGFLLKLQTQSGDFLSELNEDVLFSNEEKINLKLLPISPELFDKIDFISYLYLIRYLYDQIIIS